VLTQEGKHGTSPPAEIQLEPLELSEVVVLEQLGVPEESSRSEEVLKHQELSEIVELPKTP